MEHDLFGKPASTPRRKRTRAPLRRAFRRATAHAVALAELSRTHMEPDLAVTVLKSLGLSVSDLKNAGADPYDLEALQNEPTQEA